MSRTMQSICAGSLALACLAATAAEELPGRVAVGQEAPEIALPDLGDEIHTLSALRGDKNAVLVFFRGAW